MRELTINEVEQVSGGFLVGVGGGCAGGAIDGLMSGNGTLGAIMGCAGGTASTLAMVMAPMAGPIAGPALFLVGLGVGAATTMAQDYFSDRGSGKYGGNSS